MSPWIYPTDVPGWCHPEEAEALHRLAAGKVVLELGAYAGKSTVVMAQSARLVLSVDWHLGDEGTGPADTLSSYLANLHRYKVRDKVCVLAGRIEQASLFLPPGCVDMAYVDSAHDLESVRRDLGLALRCLRSGGTLALHDVNREAVQQAMTEFSLSPEGGCKLLAWLRIP